MNELQNFAAKGFVERVLLLEQIEQDNRTDLIPGLFALLEGSDLDDAARHAVGDTLRALLAHAEAEVVRGLGSGNPGIVALCVQVAAAHPSEAFAPALRELAARETDPEFLLQLLSALSPHRSPEALELYRRYAAHPDPFVSAHSIGMLGKWGDAASLPLLRDVVGAAASDEQFEVCSVGTEKAIEALGALGTDEALAFLVSAIHHRNPTARRFLHHEIAQAGPRSVPLLAQMLEQGDHDERILAANLLGLIGGKDAGNVLVSSFDRHLVDHANVRFAVYEALGKIPSLKGVVCLMDGLADDDPTILMVVLEGLDHQLNPGVVARVKAEMQKGDERRRAVARAVAASRALEVFAALYDDEPLGKAVVDAVAALSDPEVAAAFRERLEGLAGERAARDAERLAGVGPSAGSHRILAVDDSKSMLLFYRSVGAGLGVDVITATHGREALDLLDAGESFALILTDLNMPVMDGIEFTRKVREHFLCQGVPILMATTESEGSQRELAVKAGVNGFLSKPLNQDLLKEAIQGHL